MESVRAATPADLATVAALAEAFIAEQRPLRGGEIWAGLDARRLSPERIAAALDGAPSSPAQHLVLLGCFDDHEVGFVLASIEAVANGDLLTRIHGLYVEPDAREVGVGSALLEAVLDAASAAGCAGVDATVLPGNRDAKNFFEMHGLVARAISVFRAVGEGS